MWMDVGDGSCSPTDWSRVVLPQQDFIDWL